MWRLLGIAVGLLLVTVGVVWFASPLLDAPLSAIVGPLIKPGSPKMALDNMLSIAIGAVSLVGVLLLTWAAFAGWCRTSPTAAGANTSGSGA